MKTTIAPSLVLVNTGHGKGKSSAAFGVMLRAVARGWRVAVIQFIKSGKWRVGEEKIGRQLGVDWLKGGDGFTWESPDLDESRGDVGRAGMLGQHAEQVAPLTRTHADDWDRPGRSRVERRPDLLLHAAQALGEWRRGVGVRGVPLHPVFGRHQ